jgi:hypothetical protein
MANCRIHIFDASTARYKCTLEGHERGVWTLVLVSPSTSEPGDDDYPSSTPNPYKQGPPQSFSGRGVGRSAGNYRDEGRSRRASTGTGQTIWGTPPTQIPESATTYQPPNIGFDPASVPPSMGSRFAFGPSSSGNSEANDIHRSASASAYLGNQGQRRPGRTVHPTKRMKSSDVCGSARGWSEKGLGSRHLVVSGGCDRHLKVWDVSTG